jgi:hypothetical protein
MRKAREKVVSGHVAIADTKKPPHRETAGKREKMEVEKCLLPHAEILKWKNQMHIV